MISSEVDRMFQEVTVAPETFTAPLTRGERLARAVVLFGFLGVVGLEAWLIWQILQIWR